MRKKLAGVIVLLMSLYMAQASLEAADRILAVVNKDTITQSEADVYLNMIVLELSQHYKGKNLEEKTEDERKHLIEKMIEDKIIVQEAKRKGLQARTDKVKQRIEQIKAGYDSEVDFENSLKQRGLTIKDLENKLNDQMIMREIIEQEVRSKIIVSPDEVTKFYEARKSDFMQSETRAIESLYLEDETVLESLEEELKNNVEFQLLAQKYKAAYANDVVAKEHLRPEVREQIFELAVNETSKPLKEEKGVYFFKAREAHPPRQLALNEVHEQIFNYLFEQKFTVQMLEWLEDLKAKAYIVVK